MRKEDFIEVLPEGKIVPYRTAEELPPGPWLILSPHPDDETIGMGGTIAKAVSRGIEVYVVELTSGERGGDPDVRKSEVVKALSILGVPSENILFADFPEGSILEKEAEFKDLLGRLFDKVNPITLFVPSPFEYHPDHRAVSILTARWIKENESLFKLHHLLGFYEITRASETNFIVCIDDTVRVKVKAIKVFSSQPELKKYLRVSLGINRARTYSVNHCKFAEAFFLNPVKEFDRLFFNIVRYFDGYLEGDFVEVLRELKEKDKYVEELKSEIWNLKQEYRTEVLKRDDLIARINKEKEKLEKTIKILNKEKQKLEERILHLEREIHDLQNTIWWKLAQTFYSLRDRLFPEETFRRRCYNVLKKMIYMAVNRDFKQPFFYLKDKILLGIKSEMESKFSTEIPCFTDMLTVKKLESVEVSSSEDVAVVVVVYNNSREELKRFLDSLKSAEAYIRELVVVDNSDDRGLEEFFYLNSPVKVKYVKTDSNIGFGRGVNLGVKHAESEFILVINPDTEVRDGAVSLLLKTLLLHEDVGLVEALQFPYEHPKYYNPVTLEPVWASGCCFLVRKGVFEELGGFDENIFLYAEDVDLSWRLKASGYKIKYMPAAQVYHDFTAERSSLHKYNPLSNLYLRLKYGYPLREWFLLYIGKGVFSADVVRYFKSGVRARKKLKGCDFDVYFDRSSFGYEPFRRRGFDVPILELKHFPRVTVVVRTHNRRELLRRALTSVANQTYKNIEVIVVEDKTQVAYDVVRDFDELDVRYFRVSEGRTRALNKGVEEATGKYVMFLDDDDVIFADALQLLVSHAENRGASFVYGGSIKFETDDKIKGVLKYGYCEPFDRDRMMRENFVPMGSFIISKELADRVGPFDETLEYLEDWDFIRRAAKIEDFLFVPKDVLIYCVPQSKSLFLKRQEKLDEAYEKVVSKDAL